MAQKAFRDSGLVQPQPILQGTRHHDCANGTVRRSAKKTWPKIYYHVEAAQFTGNTCSVEEVISVLDLHGVHGLPATVPDRL